MVDLPDGGVLAHQALFLAAQLGDVAQQQEGPVPAVGAQERHGAHREGRTPGLHLAAPGPQAAAQPSNRLAAVTSSVKQ